MKQATHSSALVGLGRSTQWFSLMLFNYIVSIAEVI